MIAAIRLAQIISLGLLLALAAHADTIEEGVIAPGTPFETRWRAYDSDVEGPTVLVIGGVHGNEPSPCHPPDTMNLPTRI